MHSVTSAYSVGQKNSPHQPRFKGWSIRLYLWRGGAASHIEKSMDTRKVKNYGFGFCLQFITLGKSYTDTNKKSYFFTIKIIASLCFQSLQYKIFAEASQLYISLVFRRGKGENTRVSFLFLHIYK